MNPHNSRSEPHVSMWHATALYGLGVLASAFGAVTITFAASSDPRSQYRQQRAACLSNSTGQERSACLKESAAVLAESRSGRLAGSRPEFVYQRNAQARCDVLRDGDREDCLSRARGEGSMDGSVRSGGILRETLTTREAPAYAPAP
jgi:hypothetical protein